MNLESMIEAVEEVQGVEWNDNDDACTSSLFLIASASLGTNYAKIQSFTGLPVATCRRYGNRARRSGIWRGHKLVHSGWFDEENGGVSFLMDSLTLMGFVDRA